MEMKLLLCGAMLGVIAGLMVVPLIGAIKDLFSVLGGRPCLPNIPKHPEIPGPMPAIKPPPPVRDPRTLAERIAAAKPGEAIYLSPGDGPSRELPS